MAVTLVAVFPGGRDEDKVFRSYPELLRWLTATIQQAGWHRTPATFYLGSRNRDGTVSGYSLHVINQGVWRWRMTAEQLSTLLTLQDRYRRYCHYLTEVLPDWQDGERIPYMDNSVELIQTNRWGGTRTVTVIPPHGDLC